MEYTKQLENILSNSNYSYDKLQFSFGSKKYKWNEKKEIENYLLNLEKQLNFRIVVQKNLENPCVLYDEDYNFILVPEKKKYKKPSHYYKIVFHELFHLLGKKSFLNRKHMDEKHSENMLYTIEEEISAELFATAMCLKFNIFTEEIKSKTINYINSYKRDYPDFSKLHNKVLKMTNTALNYLKNKGF